MSSIDDNIRNAMKIVRKTQENIQKLLNHCKNLAKSDKVGYELLTEKFLRYSSDPNYWGWTFGVFALVFKGKDNVQNTLYVIEIDLDYSIINAAKYIYNAPIDFERYISPSDWSKYGEPLRNDDENFIHEHLNDFKKSIPKSDDVSKKYLGINHALFAEFPLSEINAGNIQEKIFGTFDKLAALKS